MKLSMELLYSGDYIKEEGFTSMNNDCEEILKLLTSIIKSTQTNNEEAK